MARVRIPSMPAITDLPLPSAGDLGAMFRLDGLFGRDGEYPDWADRIDELTQQAVDALAPEVSLIEESDPAAFGKVLGRTLRRAALHPLGTSKAVTRYSVGLAQATVSASMRMIGLDPVDEPVQRPAKDRRFGDEAWEQNPWFRHRLQRYLLLSQLMRDIVETSGPEGIEGAKADMATNFLIDLLSPTNFPWSNPEAIRRGVETGGMSWVNGMQNLVHDAIHNNGRPTQVDSSPFTLGENLACTPGKVVFRNDLMELIQYEPQTQEVHQVPLILSPPWINKYYVMDLAPGRSFVEWAVQHGHTVFVISYVNPSPEMSKLTMEDYLLRGPRTAIDVAMEITGAAKVNFGALCLGGTLTTILLAWLAARGESDLVGTATLLNTLTDFEDSGPLNCFTDLETVRRLEKKMSADGVLDGAQMRTTFDVLRPNDLIFNYVVRNWLLGEKPPAFDILSWNDDTTNMPATMHSFYLRECYVNNRLASGTMTMAGEDVRMGDITQHVLMVSAVNDHIAPWMTTYRGLQQMTSAASRQYVLSSAGHIAGIVNPPSPKASYRVFDGLPDDPQQWYDSAEERQQSWWELWAPWAEEHGGKMVPSRPAGSEEHPPLCDAPGTYVLMPSGV